MLIGTAEIVTLPSLTRANEAIGYGESMNVTSALFEAFLKCPTKCYLRSIGQTGGENAYAEWVHAQNDAYRSKTAKSGD